MSMHFSRPFSLIHRQAARGRHSVERCAWHRRHRLQPDAVRDPHRCLQPRAVERMAPDDWRRRSPEFQDPLLSRNLALRDALRPVASRYGVSIGAVAVAWTLSWPGSAVRSSGLGRANK